MINTNNIINFHIVWRLYALLFAISAYYFISPESTRLFTYTYALAHYLTALHASRYRLSELLKDRPLILLLLVVVMVICSYTKFPDIILVLGFHFVSSDVFTVTRSFEKNPDSTLFKVVRLPIYSFFRFTFYLLIFSFLAAEGSILAYFSTELRLILAIAILLTQFIYLLKVAPMERKATMTFILFEALLFIVPFLQSISLQTLIVHHATTYHATIWLIIPLGLWKSKGNKKDNLISRLATSRYILATAILFFFMFYFSKLVPSNFFTITEDQYHAMFVHGFYLHMFISFATSGSNVPFITNLFPKRA